MRSHNSLVPANNADDVSVYLVLDDFGALGRAYRETDEAAANLSTLIDDMLAGQFNCPVRVVAFNTAEGWSSDVSEDVAGLVTEKARAEGRQLTEGARKFVDRVGGVGVTVSKR
jgi:hypothetical protein